MYIRSTRKKDARMVRRSILRIWREQVWGVEKKGEIEKEKGKCRTPFGCDLQKPCEGQQTLRREDKEAKEEKLVWRNFDLVNPHDKSRGFKKGK